MATRRVAGRQQVAIDGDVEAEVQALRDRVPVQHLEFAEGFEGVGQGVPEVEALPPPGPLQKGEPSGRSWVHGPSTLVAEARLTVSLGSVS